MGSGVDRLESKFRSAHWPSFTSLDDIQWLLFLMTTDEKNVVSFSIPRGFWLQILCFIVCMNANEQNRRVTWWMAVWRHNVFPVFCKFLRGNLVQKCFYISASSTVWKSLTCFTMNAWNGHLSCSLYLYSLCALKRTKSEWREFIIALCWVG